MFQLKLTKNVKVIKITLLDTLVLNTLSHTNALLSLLHVRVEQVALQLC